MPAISTLTAVLNLDQSGFRSGIDDSKRDLETLQEKTQRAGERLTSAGKTMTAGITAPLMAMGALSARTAASFDQNMQRSIAVMGDVDEAMREDLEQTARQVANTTTHSADQAAQSYYYLASAGLDAQQAMESMPRVAAFAEAGNMEMAEATDVATNVMSAFGYEASEMTEVTDTLTATVSNHNQTMQGMSTAMSKVAPVASSLGFSIEETSAAIGQMGDVGIQGERAGTALRNVMSQISDEGSTVTKKLEEMGVATRDSEGNILSLTQILQNMEKAGVEAGDAASIFGTEAGPAMAALMQEGSSALQENTNRLREAEGATEDMASTQRKTLNAQMQKTKSNIKDVGISIGTQLLPMLLSLTRHVKGAAETFQGMSDGQQKALIAAAGLAAALGPVLMIAGMMAQSIVALSGAYGVLTGTSLTLSGALSGGLVPSLIATNVALGPLTIPVWAIIAAIGALIAIVGALYYAWDKNILGIRDKTKAAFETVKGWLDSVPNWLLAITGPLGALYAAWGSNLFGIQNIVGSVFDWIGEKIDWLMEYIEKIPGVGGDDDDGGGPSIESPDRPEPPDPEELGMETEKMGGDMGQDWQQEGQSAGQSFGQGFGDGLVEGIETEEVATHLEEEIQSRESNVSDLKQDIERLERLQERDVLSESGEVKLSIKQDDLKETRSELEKLESQLESAENAEDITDVDNKAVANVAQKRLEQEQERAENIQDIYDKIDSSEIEGEIDTEVGASISDEDIEGIDAESIEAMQQGGQNEGTSYREQIVALLEQLITRFDEPFDLSITDGTVETDEGHIIEIVDGRLEQRTSQADVRSGSRQ